VLALLNTFFGTIVTVVLTETSTVGSISSDNVIFGITFDVLPYVTSTLKVQLVAGC
jgi:hypothetical protein